MDTIDYLVGRQKAELALADVAACISSRMAHMGLARAYGQRIKGRLPKPTTGVASAGSSSSPITAPLA